MALDCGNAGTCSPIEWREFTAILDQDGVDLSDEAGVQSATALLGRLYANRTFLVDTAIARLKENWSSQGDDSGYGTQVLMLHRCKNRHFVRANFWPADNDPVLLASGARHFFYHVAHDHNFDFVTVGYMGPGYGSRWYDYENKDVHGFPGEQAGLTLVEDGALTQGRLLHYRAHKDVHEQLPPTALSVSLNIVPESSVAVWRDQYLFDHDRGTVVAIPTISPLEIALRIAAVMDERGVDLAHDYSRHHPSERVRWQAWKALIGVAPLGEKRLMLYEAATLDKSRLVSGHAGAMLSALTDAARMSAGNDQANGRLYVADGGGL